MSAGHPPDREHSSSCAIRPQASCRCVPSPPVRSSTPRWCCCARAAPACSSWRLAVALAEQAVLFPLRRLADVDLTFLPDTGRLGPWGALVVVGVATEALAIGVLGASRIRAGAAGAARDVGAAHGAGRVGALIGRAAAGRACSAPRRRRPSCWCWCRCRSRASCWPALITVLLWVPTYGLLGLVAPAVVIDRQGPARAAAPVGAAGRPDRHAGRADPGARLRELAAGPARP